MLALKRCLVLFFLVCHFSFLFAQPSVLRFNKEGQFKIVQFTDIHFKYQEPASDIAIVRMNEILDAEKPDLVVITGDLIYSSPGDKPMQEVLEVVSAHKIPFVVTFGNHDDELGLSRSELYDLIREIPYNLLRERGSSLSPDYVLTVKSSSDETKDAALLYCMDSNAYSTLNDLKGYGWFAFEQIQWYRETSAYYTKQNENIPLPAMTFFHIPLPEYHEAVTHESAIVRGTRMEKVCAPQINTGMFAAMKECGDVMATFVGHDHDNDYAVMWHNILLAYGRFTGGNTEYNHLPNGARVILLNEGERSFTTWICQKHGEIVDRFIYPNSFIRE